MIDLPEKEQADEDDLMFKHGVEDGDVATYRGGRIKPEEQEIPESNIILEENFTDGNKWDAAISGTGASATISGGIATLSSGTTDDGYALFKYNGTAFGSVEENGSLTIEFRARANYSAALKQEWWCGFYNPDDGHDLGGDDDFDIIGYNLDENGDNWEAAGNGDGNGGWELQDITTFTYQDNLWQTYKIILAGEKAVYFYIDGNLAATKLINTGYKLGTDVALGIIFKTITRGAAGATQTLEIDWIKVSRG